MITTLEKKGRNSAPSLDSSRVSERVALTLCLSSLERFDLSLSKAETCFKLRMKKGRE